MKQSSFFHPQASDSKSPHDVSLKDGSAVRRPSFVNWEVFPLPNGQWGISNLLKVYLSEREDLAYQSAEIFNREKRIR
jgi:hypothetical protein